MTVAAVVVVLAAALVLRPGSEPVLVAPTGPDGSTVTTGVETTAPTATTTAPETATSRRPPATSTTTRPPTATVAPAPPPPAGPGVWKFLLPAPDGTSLLRWACGAIHWAIEPGATAEQSADATAVVGEVAARTGRSFVFDGAGTPDNPDIGQIVVSFDPARVPPGAVGYGGPIKGPGLYNFVIIAGRVLVAGQRAAQRQILRHEFGHNMGLDNVDSTREVMNRWYTPMSGWGPGTDHALAGLGACYPSGLSSGPVRRM